jgi:hypothetical protein
LDKGGLVEMKKIILLFAIIIAFYSINAQNNKNQSKFNSQNPQYAFVENKGQIHDQSFKSNPEVKYLLCLGNGMNVQLKRNSFCYDTYKTEVNEKEAEYFEDKIPTKVSPKKAISYSFHRVDVELIGANVNPQIVSEEPSSDYVNYYNSVTPESGATFVHNYKKVTYKNIYNGIDMVFEAYSTKEKPIEYTFVVHPGADAKQIKLQYIGAKKTELKENKINIEVAQGILTENIPASWIKETKEKQYITYKVIDKNTYGFEIPHYPHDKTLIIDPNPNLEWGTYYGGTNGDFGNGICQNGNNLFIIAETASSNAIATIGAHQSTIGSDYDVFLVKFNTNGIRQWGTYYGGDDRDYCHGIDCDNFGNVLIVGSSSSTNAISTTGSHQELLDGLQNAFVAKFNSNGIRQWGTYYGGHGANGYGIKCESGGNVYITGSTLSMNGISTLGTHQEVFGGGADAYVAKFNSNGVRQWGTYYGGTSGDVGNAITCDTIGNIFVTGYTTSGDAIASNGAHQVNNGGGMCDAFVVKFNSVGARQWGTYYGGSEEDYSHGLACNLSGDLFITGYSMSSNSISTIDSYQPTLSSFSDAFITKFNSSGVRQWGTYYGGSTGISLGHGITCDIEGGILITGATSSNIGIATSNTYQSNYGGGGDVFAAKFNSNGIRQWGTYYGGSGSDYSCGIACDSISNFYIVGYTDSEDSIVTAGAHQTIYGGVQDAFIAKFSSGSNGISEENISSSNYLVYPNPVSYQLTIEIVGATEKTNFEILNSIGQVIFKGTMQEKAKINTSTFSSGVYFIKLENGKTFEFKKVVKE